MSKGRKDLKLFAPEAVQINRTRGRPPAASTAARSKLERFFEDQKPKNKRTTKTKSQVRAHLSRLLGKFETATDAQQIYKLFIEPFLKAMGEHGYQDGKRATEWLFMMESRRIHTLYVDKAFKMPGKVLGAAPNPIRAANNGDVLIIAEIDEPSRHIFNVELIHKNYDLHCPVVFQLTKNEFALNVLSNCIKEN